MWIMPTELVREVHARGEWDFFTHYRLFAFSAWQILIAEITRLLGRLMRVAGAALKWLFVRKTLMLTK